VTAFADLAITSAHELAAGWRAKIMSTPAADRPALCRTLVKQLRQDLHTLHGSQIANITELNRRTVAAFAVEIENIASGKDHTNVQA
jgi:hypothetical protein